MSVKQDRDPTVIGCTDPMMQTGFAALGFTEQQIEAFFKAAAAL